MKEMRAPYFDPFQVKLIQDDDPLARAVMEVQHRYPGSLAMNYNGRYLGGMSIEGGIFTHCRAPRQSTDADSVTGL